MNRNKILTVFIASISLIALNELQARGTTFPMEIAAADMSVIYLDNRLEPVHAKGDAVYYAELVETQARGYHFRVFFLTGELKMDGWYADEAMNIPQGYFTFYHRSGQIESEGEYRDGAKFGIWKRYTRSGEPKSERIYAFTPMMKAIGVMK